MKQFFKVALVYSLLINFEYAVAQTQSESGKLTTAGEFFSALARQQAEPISIDSSNQQQTIMGRKTLRSVRFQLQKTTLAFYEMFNELNSSDEMDIVCEHGENGRNLLFSTSIICEPAFMERVRRASEESRALRAEKIPRAISWLIQPRKLTEEELRASASDLFDNLENEMSELVNGNQPMQAQLIRVDELQSEYQSMLQEIQSLRKRPFFYDDAEESFGNSYLDNPTLEAESTFR